jgi:sodium transport system permease protein
VIDATAGERERNSLEPLLATPAKRAVIMSGKIMAACTFGLISLVLTRPCSSSASSSRRVLASSWMFVLGAARILLVLLPIVLIGTCLLTLTPQAPRASRKRRAT